MMFLVIALLAVVAGIALTVLIPEDGYGTRPGPRSHADQSDPRFIRA